MSNPPNAVMSRITRSLFAEQCPFCMKLAHPVFHHELSVDKGHLEWINNGSACYKCLGTRTHFLMGFRDALADSLKQQRAETPTKRKFFKIDQAPDRK